MSWEEAKKFARTHLVEAAKEIQEMRQNGSLSGDKVRTIAELIKKSVPEASVLHAERMVGDLLIEQVVNNASNTPRFPTMLRKMWSGGEVQEWIDRQLPLCALARQVTPIAPKGFTVTRPTGAVVREHDRWEIYRDGDGGVVDDRDVKDWTVRALLDAMTDSALTPVQFAEQAQSILNPESCDRRVYEDGESVGLFDIPKELAESFCASATRITGHRFDWHYIGGRVHIKVLKRKEGAGHE